MASCCNEKCQAMRYAPTGMMTHQGSRALNQTKSTHAPYSTKATSQVGPSTWKNAFFTSACRLWGQIQRVSGEAEKDPAPQNAGGSAAERRFSRQYRPAASKFTRNAS